MLILHCIDGIEPRDGSSGRTEGIESEVCIGMSSGMSVNAILGLTATTEPGSRADNANRPGYVNCDELDCRKACRC